MSAPRVPAAPLGVLVLLVALVGAWWLFRTPVPAAPEIPPADAAPVPPTPPVAPLVAPAAAPLGERAAFVNEAVCAACHADQAEAWSASHHALAMQPATTDTVLGDFDDARFEDASGVTRFLRAAPEEGGPWPDAGFRVETTGPDGKRTTFPVPYVFGVDPLQQLLLPLPGGRLQALSVAWDVAGKRWYSLYPDETIGPRDPLHWSKGALNWNFSCAECHATDLVRGFDEARDAYETRWARLDVGCQACHGPASGHLAWVGGDLEDPDGRGFQAPISRDSHTEVEACARCHSRRAPLGDGFDHRGRLMDDFLPALLSEGLYFADGQIEDEVYEYGSYLQSKMHAKGVRCSDCHDPHAAGLRRPGNLLCTQCHSATPTLPEHVDGRTLVRKGYDTTSHTGHAPGTPGSFCVDCHMPARTYMGVDPRRDHGLRVPRPALSAEVGAPDACAGCHGERDAGWAAEWIARRDAPRDKGVPFGRALHAGRRGLAGAAEGLLALAGSDAPAIVRATALELLARYPGPRALTAQAAALEDEDPLVRHAALGGFEILPAAQRGPVQALLGDPVRAVRIEAARLLLDERGTADGPSRAAAEREFEAAQRTLVDRPEARLNLARLLAARGDAEAAEGELRAARRIDPTYVPAAVNLAEHVRARSEPEAEALLREALDAVPRAAPLEHALGLSLVRQGRRAEALEWLSRAASHAPDEPRFGYVLAVALEDAGRRDEALAELERVRAETPWFRDAHLALAGFQQAAGDGEGAARTLATLAAINPDDPALPPR